MKDIKSIGPKSSCALPTGGKRKAVLWISLIAVSTVAGTLLGSASSGLVFGLMLGLPLFAGG